MYRVDPSNLSCQTVQIYEPRSVPEVHPVFVKETKGGPVELILFRFEKISLTGPPCTCLTLERAGAA